MLIWFILGAYGKVYQVQHRTTGMIRAMKSIKKKTVLREEQEKLFSEVSILKGLDHPNIVKLYELYQDENCYYLVTEWIFFSLSIWANIIGFALEENYSIEFKPCTHSVKRWQQIIWSKSCLLLFIVMIRILCTGINCKERKWV